MSEQQQWYLTLAIIVALFVTAAFVGAWLLRREVRRPLVVEGDVEPAELLVPQQPVRRPHARPVRYVPAHRDPLLSDDHTMVIRPVLAPPSHRRRRGTVYGSGEKR
jgi:hypothetical protein